ncbi:AraC family transcriptional regulator [Emcibacter nanhaiensis]|uniref:AraC family transcriptional regulator n=1 Tax=Emcibacter nanhaiensis TaxID=1505037 RepID=A0A501PG03_9PROT|nr:AraC family transcriptional regulator [Emcibacter nanhaiensis]TPD58932.1 AraC family transcriptional regulator [Emcibacter nanhaiensis]
MTASNIYLSEFYHLAEDKGLDALDMLRKAGIDRHMVDTPGKRVETDKLAFFVQNLMHCLEDEAMGLAEHRIPIGAFFMMGKMAISEPTLGKALLTGIRLYSMMTNAFRMELQEQGNYARLIFRLNTPDLDKNHLLAEINLMAWHRLSAWLISENLQLHEIYFDYPSPRHVGEYAYLFPGQHKFCADYHGFCFHRNFLDREISQTSGSLKRFIKRCPEVLFIQPQTDFSISYELKKLLKKKLPDGIPVIEEAADTLHMTKRTLIRKLRDEGTSYQQLKDLVRRDKAVKMMTSRATSLSSVAEAVGFSDPAVFSRAFKGWTGVCPREYRQNLEDVPAVNHG